MRSIPKLEWFLIILALLTFSNLVIAQEKDLYDEGAPEVTARVARISFMRGDVQIKRSGENDWDLASLNLPLVEGDEIATSRNARVEIQFDSQNFLRLAEDSLLKVTTLRDEGIAVSLTEGTLSLRVFSFEKEKGYFEIDAPQTTLSVQNAGLFRIDARNQYEVRVTATEGGQARIYSDNSGFTLRNRRSAKIFLDNERLGEWETSDASRYSVEWDSWIAERDSKLAKLLNNSYYDKYYDRDIFGAEDLNDYGSWSDSNDYGKIWRPYQSAISIYSNWSPYRYGHWAWVNPFGWTWVNDESWGWATYHYGRWISDNRGWFWTPYEYHRSQQSWWKPALVVIFNLGNDICWYPLSHQDRYRDYNRDYRRNNHDRRDPDFGDRRDNKNSVRPDLRSLSENSIVGIRSDEFGKRRNNVRSIPSQNVRQSLENNPDQIAQLPKFEERRREFSQDSNLRRRQQAEQIKTGVGEREAGVELDRQLQNERFRSTRQQNTRIRQPENSPNEVQKRTENNDSSRNERTRQPQIFNNGVPNRTENSDSRKNERTERRSSNSETQNQPNYPTQVYRQPPPVVKALPRPDENSERRNTERQPSRNEVQRPANIPPNNNSEQNNRPARVRDNNSEENNQRSRIREKNAESDNQNEVRQDNPQENRRSAPPPRSEQPQPQRQERQEPRSEEPKVESRREAPRVERREQPRQEQPRVEPRQEQPRQERQEQRREEPRVEPRREEPRVERREPPRQEQPRVEPRREEPRQEQPRQKEPQKEERRSVPPPRSETKREKPETEKIDN